MPGQPNEWVKVAINAISTFLAKLAVSLSGGGSARTPK
jgi:hypothetical protein